MTLIASGVDDAPAHIGSVNLSIGDASYFDRSFQTVTGSLDDVSVTLNKGDVVHVGDISVDGPADAASATAHMSAADTDRLIRLAGARAGLTIDDVQVGDSGVSVKVSGIQSNAELAVTGGALVLDPGVGSAIVLLATGAVRSVAAQGGVDRRDRPQRPCRRRHGPADAQHHQFGSGHRTLSRSARMCTGLLAIASLDFADAVVSGAIRFRLRMTVRTN